MRHTFELKPFGEVGEPGKGVVAPEISIGGWAERAGEEGLLMLHYELTGDLEKLVIPAPAPRPRRLDGLWQSTCLEWFGAACGRAPYWECNLSPSGDWNLYRLADYRQELAEEKNSPTLSFSVLQGANTLSLDLCCPLPAELAQAKPLELGICAVIEQRSTRGLTEKARHLSYWALAHPGPEADFHLRPGWTLRL